MKGKTLLYTSSIAVASNNLSPLHFTSILTHTIARSDMFSSETKYCYSRSDVRSQLVPFSAIPRSWTWKRANLPTLKIHIKLKKIATTIIFSKWWSVRKGNLYYGKKIGGVSGTLSLLLFFYFSVVIHSGEILASVWQEEGKFEVLKRCYIQIVFLLC